MVAQRFTAERNLAEQYELNLLLLDNPEIILKLKLNLLINFTLW